MKSKKVIASMLMASICLAGATACNKEPIATGASEGTVMTDAAGNVIDPDLYPAIENEDDLAAVEGETGVSEEISDVLPYFISDFGVIDCTVNPVGAELLVATADSEFGTYNCEFANYDHGDTIQIIVNLDEEEYDELNYSVMFTEANTDWDSEEVVTAVTSRQEDGSFIVAFEDVEEANGVYTVQIFNGAGQAWISVSVGYTEDTIADYFAPFYGDDVADSVVELGAVDEEAETSASETVADE